MALAGRQNAPEPDQLDTQTRRFFQTASLLPEHYGSTLDSEAMSVDAFYALSEVFLFAATSEKQFLNHMELRIKREIYSAEDVTDFSIANLKHSRELLESHSQTLDDTLMSFRKARLMWPSAPPNHDKLGLISSKYDSTIEDFEYLRSRARELSVRCLEGVDLITNDVMLQESRKAMDQREQTKTLTLLAFYYLPISLTFGFFGMNFKEFVPDSSLRLWLCFLTGFVLLAVQHLIYIFRGTINRRCHRIRDLLA
jgi:hypothetical protein